MQGGSHSGADQFAPCACDPENEKNVQHRKEKADVEKDLGLEDFSHFPAKVLGHVSKAFTVTISTISNQQNLSFTADKR